MMFQKSLIQTRNSGNLNQPNVLRKIKIGNDKVITFKEISEAFNSELNKSSAGSTTASLSCKEGRVILHLKSDTLASQRQNIWENRKGTEDQNQ